MSPQETLGVIAVILTFAGYVPYIRDIIRHKTKPHIYTWFTSGLVTAIAFALQVSDTAGVGASATFAASMICFIIFAFGVRQGERNITVSDTFFFLLSLVALVIWLFAKQPVISIILLSTIDVLAFAPTIRKSWHKPSEETLSSYAINTFRFGIAILALQHYTTVTYFYPVTCMIVNGLFSAFLVMRRKQLAIASLLDPPYTS